MDMIFITGLVIMMAGAVALFFIKREEKRMGNQDK